MSVPLLGIAAAAVLSGMASGCVHRLRPLQVPRIPLSPARQSFESGASVSLINGRPGAELKTIHELFWHRYEVDPTEWTRDFLVGLADELERRGVKVDAAGTEVALAVDLHSDPGQSRSLPVLEVTVRIGTWLRGYPRQRPEAGFRSMKDALETAMRAVLEDPEFWRAVGGTVLSSQ